MKEILLKIDELVRNESIYECERIGDGMFGDIFLVEGFAVKVYKPCFETNYIKEGEHLQLLQHLAVPRVHAFTDRYCVMEYIKGYTVKETLRRLYRGEQVVLPAVGFVHQLHRTIKGILAAGLFPYDLHSGNVMINEQGHAIVIDTAAYYELKNRKLDEAGLELQMSAILRDLHDIQRESEVMKSAV